MSYREILKQETESIKKHKKELRKEEQVVFFGRFRNRKQIIQEKIKLKTDWQELINFLRWFEDNYSYKKHKVRYFREKLNVGYVDSFSYIIGRSNLNKHFTFKYKKRFILIRYLYEQEAKPKDMALYKFYKIENEINDFIDKFIEEENIEEFLIREK